MKPYGRDFEPKRVRGWPDPGDVANLGLASRIGNLKSSDRRWSRRRWAKKLRRDEREACLTWK